MSLTNEEHLIFVRLEKILDSMSVTIKEIRDKLEVLSDKLCPKPPERITQGDNQDYVAVLEQFLLTKSEYTREDKVKSGTYILHDMQVNEHITVRDESDFVDVIKPGKYVLFVSEKHLYICGDDSGICTYLHEPLDSGIRVLAMALKHRTITIKGFTLPKEDSNE